MRFYSFECMKKNKSSKIFVLCQSKVCFVNMPSNFRSAISDCSRYSFSSHNILICKRDDITILHTSYDTGLQRGGKFSVNFRKLTIGC